MLRPLYSSFLGTGESGVLARRKFKFGLFSIKKNDPFARRHTFGQQPRANGDGDGVAGRYCVHSSEYTFRYIYTSSLFYQRWNILEPRSIVIVAMLPKFCYDSPRSLGVSTIYVSGHDMYVRAWQNVDAFIDTLGTQRTRAKPHQVHTKSSLRNECKTKASTHNNSVVR